jgi:hypothetical protein
MLTIVGMLEAVFCPPRGYITWIPAELQLELSAVQLSEMT